VRSCDCAVVPYPLGGYYRSVCPTKLAFYALCRVPVLATPMDEVRGPIERHALGEIRDLTTWFESWPALSRQFRGFAGGRDLDRLTWDAAIEPILGHGTGEGAD
jgi:hypothetical protein